MIDIKFLLQKNTKKKTKNIYGKSDWQWMFDASFGKQAIVCLVTLDAAF